MRSGYPESDPPIQTCCWDEDVPSGTGNPSLGGDKERYCQTCNLDEDGNPTECTEKELQYTGTTSTRAPTPTPRGPLGFPEDGVLQQPTPAPTSPQGPRPFSPLGEGTIQEPQTTPTPTPEDDQSDDGPGPFRGPLGGGVLQEPDDEENVEPEGEDEEEDGSSEGAETVGPLT